MYTILEFFIDSMDFGKSNSKSLALYGLMSILLYYCGYQTLAYILFYPLYFLGSVYFSNSLLEWFDKLPGRGGEGMGLFGAFLCVIAVCILNIIYLGYGLVKLFIWMML